MFVCHSICLSICPFVFLLLSSLHSIHSAHIGNRSDIRNVPMVCYKVRVIRNVPMVWYQVRVIRNVPMVCYQVRVIRNVPMMCYQVRVIRNVPMMCCKVRVIKNVPMVCYKVRAIRNAPWCVIRSEPPEMPFQERSSSASYFHACLFQAIDGVMSLALCRQVVSQAPQHFGRDSEKRAICEGCFAR